MFGNLMNSLADITPGVAAGLAIAMLILGGAASVIAFYFIQKKRSKGAATNVAKLYSDAEAEVRKMRDDARDEAKKLRQEVLIEAKEEQLRLRTEFDKETRERRFEIKKTEDRILQREQQLDRKEGVLDSKIELIEKQREDLAKKEEAFAVKEQEVRAAKERVLDEIQKAAGMSREEAKEYLISEMRDEAARRGGHGQRNRAGSARGRGQKSEKHHRFRNSTHRGGPFFRNDGLGGAAAER